MPHIRHLPENIHGRDFVIGDLHGEIGQLSRELQRVDFDERKDRLFSVGDLIDRGEDSLGAFRLLKEPWFHAVQGNHERMMCEYLFGGTNDFGWALEEGLWYQSVEDTNEALALARIAQSLPFLIVVGECVNRFQVVHAEMPNMDCPISNQLDSDAIEHMTWSPQLHRSVNAFQACNALMEPLGSPVAIAELEGLANYQPVDTNHVLTFCGHSMLCRPMLWHSHYFVDTGAGWPGGKLSLINVRDAIEQYRYWVQYV